MSDLHLMRYEARMEESIPSEPVQTSFCYNVLNVNLNKMIAKFILSIVKTRKINYIIFLISICSFMANAQTGGVAIKGRTMERIHNEIEPIIAVKLSVVNSNRRSTSDNNGFFTIVVNENMLPTQLKFSRRGYETRTIQINDELDLADLSKREITVEMKEGTGESEIVYGIRNKFADEIAIPLTVLSKDDLNGTNKFLVDRALTYTLPSFNATQQTISDGAAHFDPFDLRGLGSSRTLVLINGKRKNMSSYLNVQDTPNKSEVGIDFRSIPFNAIEEIVVLRDGETVRYGSDAIAGVIDIRLKKDVTTDLEIHSGITSVGDGLLLNTSVSTGTLIGKRGTLHLGATYTNQSQTNRAKPTTEDQFFLPKDSAALQWIERNPTLGMVVGIPNTSNLNAYHNFETSVKENFTFYSFGTYTQRKGQSYGVYRTPYWVADPSNIFHRYDEPDNGFLPELILDINDVYLTNGVKQQGDSWAYDLSLSTGKHVSGYNVSNTFNAELGAESPTTFAAGSYEFATQVLDFIAGKNWDIFELEAGWQFRAERFKIFAGQEESYQGEGAISFPGLQPRNALDRNRYNVGGFVDLNGAFLKDKQLYLGVIGRLENYSDFGVNLSYKSTALYRWKENLRIRAGYNTGFRAPTLHQYYLSNVQTVVNGNSIANQGTFNHESPVLRILGVEPLKEEISKGANLGVDLDVQINKRGKRSKIEVGIDVTLYTIKIEDRIIFSGDIDTSFQSIRPILEQYNIDGIKFFTNAIDTRTNGIDLDVSFRNLLGSPQSNQQLNASIKANLIKHQIVGDLKLPSVFTNAKEEKSIFNRQEQSRVTTHRPATKLITKLDYRYLTWFDLDVLATRFGRVAWKHPEPVVDQMIKDQVYSPKWVIDVGLTIPARSAASKFKAKLSINNIFNNYSDPIDNQGDSLTDLGGRFYYPWEVNQFDFLGTNFLLNFYYQLN